MASNQSNNQVMKYTNINFMVKSRKQADALADICAMFYSEAVVTSVGYIGGYFHEAPAVIRCSYESDHHGRLAWEKLVTTLIRKGYSDCIC
jgi:hypothetical protein